MRLIVCWFVCFIGFAVVICFMGGIARRRFPLLFQIQKMTPAPFWKKENGGAGTMPKLYRIFIVITINGNNSLQNKETSIIHGDF